MALIPTISSDGYLSRLRVFGCQPMGFIISDSRFVTDGLLHFRFGSFIRVFESWFSIF